MSIYCEHF